MTHCDEHAKVLFPARSWHKSYQRHICEDLPSVQSDFNVSGFSSLFWMGSASRARSCWRSVGHLTHWERNTWIFKRLAENKKKILRCKLQFVTTPTRSSHAQPLKPRARARSVTLRHKWCGSHRVRREFYKRTDRSFFPKFCLELPEAVTVCDCHFKRGKQFLYTWKQEQGIV